MFASCTGVCLCASLGVLKSLDLGILTSRQHGILGPEVSLQVLIVCVHLSAGERECWCPLYY